MATETKTTAGAVTPSGGQKGTEAAVREAAASDETVSKKELTKDAEGRLIDPSLAEPTLALEDRDNTPMAPVPQGQTDPGATDPMKRQPGEGAGGPTPPQPKATKSYVLTKPFWDGHELHPRGEVMFFPEGDQPRVSKLVVA